ncbi:hypothetical protein OsI_12584 [Oryza sativa Indica Group]|jgi:hypothetical protein|uniref:Uncharacterized protein n=3 Tax=Oryza sativa TaxID=4530 RepID=A3AKB9_ORYSJ|nr:hypothetical protein LOC_Os03g41320 [Oryza sativa Japonica Group]AAR89880.1 hypothetical protein [Oryza sativa Japonica Group]ABF97568.1 expressed protein [Oryza sativa Japonica Group]EAY90975.1 hypothetical protein OsI_12584 [Oryza sativa Indica Group]EAZ27758.1 hypothetical protein OsJ_11703 [Oryza sativa Japonica Group]
MGEKIVQTGGGKEAQRGGEGERGKRRTRREGGMVEEAHREGRRGDRGAEAAHLEEDDASAARSCKGEAALGVGREGREERR